MSHNEFRSFDISPPSVLRVRSVRFVCISMDTDFDTFVLFKCCLYFPGEFEFCGDFFVFEDLFGGVSIDFSTTESEAKNSKTAQVQVHVTRELR